MFFLEAGLPPSVHFDAETLVGSASVSSLSTCRGSNKFCFNIDRLGYAELVCALGTFVHKVLKTKDLEFSRSGVHISSLVVDGSFYDIDSSNQRLVH